MPVMSSNSTYDSGHDALATSAEDFLKASYDFVICGGGTAGLTLAARLSEIPNVNVGVIEAGACGLDDMLVDTPLMFAQLFKKPEYEWCFMTTPQAGNKNKVHHLVRGKLLGGSSAINYMMYVRGSDADYDDWADLVHDNRWSSASLKRYMRKHQTLEPVDPTMTDRTTIPFVGENHGTDGPVRTSFNDSRFPIEDAVIKACDQVTGYTKKPIDPWSGDHLGFFNTLGNVYRTGPNKGKRSYAARDYFEPNRKRPNLKVLCEAMVNKVILEGDTAVGVSFSYKGKTHEVKTKREVIVCGGTIQSPQILELSGIGDPEVLHAAGVECKIELPGVGNNFQDHVCEIVGYELAPGLVTMDSLKSSVGLGQAADIYQKTGGGPLTCISSTQGFFPYKLVASPEELQETIASLRNTKTKTDFERKQLDKIIAHLEDDKSANLQMVFIPTTADLVNGIEDQSILMGKAPKDGINGITMTLILSYPASRGSIHITSSDVNVHPNIDPAYGIHPADRALLAAGFKFMESVVKAPQLASMVRKRTFPPPSVNLEDPKELKTQVEDFCAGTYHPIGTCALGEVLDGDCKVKGVKNLRVVDASIFPNHISGNICSSVYAVAECAADIIKAQYGWL